MPPLHSHALRLLILKWVKTIQEELLLDNECDEDITEHKEEEPN